MSTYYYANLFVKKEDGWKLIAKSIDCNQIKNVMFGYDMPGNAYDPDDDLLALKKSETLHYSDKFLGSIKKEDFDRLTKGRDIKKDTNPYRSPVDSDNYFLNVGSKDILKKIHDENLFVDDFSQKKMEDYFKMTDEQKKEYNAQFVNISWEYPNYAKGTFYAIDSFDEDIKKLKKRAAENKEKYAEWKKISSSLEYLKLSEEEKENVRENYEYVIECVEGEDDDYGEKSQLEVFEQFKHVLEFFTDWKEPAVLHIYSDYDFYNEEEDWVWGKDKY